MKKILVILFLSLTSLLSAQEVAEGKVVLDSIYSKNLENDFGENPTRKVSVYLPPNYEDSKTRYPVIYFLHGFLNDNSLMNYMKDLLDYAIAAEKIDPFILVIPDQRTTYDGSFYSNTGIFGNWEDFTAYDLVSYMDNNYRTLAKPGSRGITGHSMGGYGALKIAMKHPDIFETVYALSPGALTIVREYGPNSNTYVEFSKMKTIEDLSKSYFGKVIMAFGRSWSPNANKPPFYFDLPFEYKNETIVANPEALEKWYSEMPVHMIDEYLENLNKLRAIKFDWGRNAGERFTIQCKMFSQRLENVGVKHFAEEYIGTHTNNIYTQDGRIPQQMLPFFDFYLDFE
ncbi:alpha/beta hydrolase [Maribacter cobaltidurans]|uniref:Esterase n=1 Tax=Maribacter cobaltidurans TaxID=1178778 RepID=A0A223V3Y6_9FLAO|nr:alpha/beta fold hydrolase [Maribacter cobaltidurans]ASV30042.1 esterase [Maribacter cobaltidurans]GGD87674.1 esterase [Maribacter cobaltidurans]